MEINIEKLIHTVKEYSILYDTNNKLYYDRSKKKRAWEKICASLNENWDSWDDNERSLYYKEVQKKWQSLRDCFRRELIIQKTPPPPTGKKKAKYKYFDVLTFLTPFTQNVNADSSGPEDGSFLKYEETSSNSKSFLKEENAESSSNSKDPLSEYHVPSRKRKPSTAFIEEVPVLNDFVHDNTNRARFVDDDEAFLFSLLPSFKEYNQDQKYMLRIELMKTILRFKQTQRDLRSVNGGIVDVDDELRSVKGEIVDDDDEYVY